MGVRGLLTWMKEKGALERFCRRLPVAEGEGFVVDGNGFAHWVCNQESCSRPLIDVDYADLCDRVRKFVDEFEAAGSTLLFLFDLYAGQEKMETKITRMSTQVDALSSIAGSLLDQSSIHVHSLPLLAIPCIIEVLNEYSTVEAKFANGEADEYLVRSALSRNAAAIISNDTDMLVYHAFQQNGREQMEVVSAPGLVLFKDEMFIKEKDNDLYVNLLDSQRIAATLGIPQHHICRVAALCGYDNTNFLIKEEIYAFLDRLSKNKHTGTRKLQKGPGKGKESSNKKSKGNRGKGANPRSSEEISRVSHDEVASTKAGSKETPEEHHYLRTYVNKAKNNRGISSKPGKGLSSVKALKAAAAFVKVHSHVADGSWLGATSSEGTPPCLNSEVYASEEHYCLGLLSNATSSEPGLFSTGEVIPAWEQVIRTGVYLDPIWRLFSSQEGDQLCKKLLQSIRARAYALLGASEVMEVSEAGEHLVCSRVQAEPSPRYQQQSCAERLRECLLGYDQSKDGCDHDDKIASESGGDEAAVTLETLTSCASLLRRKLLVEAGLTDIDGRHNEMSGVSASAVDLWTLAQLAVLYTNYVAFATTAEPRLSLSMLNRESVYHLFTC